jgi:hypothetical protein
MYSYFHIHFYNICKLCLRVGYANIKVVVNTCNELDDHDGHSKFKILIIFVHGNYILYTFLIFLYNKNHFKFAYY